MELPDRPSLELPETGLETNADRLQSPRDTTERELSRLPDAFRQILEESSLQSSLASLERLRPDTVDPAWLRSEVSHLRLKVSLAATRLTRLTEKGEALLARHVEQYGEDFTFAMQQAIILEPMRKKLEEWQILIQELRTLEKSLHLVRQQSQALELSSLIQSIQKSLHTETV